jgi:hypothetical protein
VESCNFLRLGLVQQIAQFRTAIWPRAVANAGRSQITKVLPFNGRAQVRDRPVEAQLHDGRSGRALLLAGLLEGPAALLPRVFSVRVREGGTQPLSSS